MREFPITVRRKERKETCDLILYLVGSQIDILTNNNID